MLAQESRDDGQEGAMKSLHDGYLPTPGQTVAKILVGGMMTCNFQLPKDGFCCAHHLAMKCSTELLQRLCDGPCHADWPEPVAQCSECGALVLDFSNDSVPVCGYCGDNTYRTKLSTKLSM